MTAEMTKSLNHKRNLKIAVIRFSSLGDIILVLPALKILRRGLPEATIKIIVKKQYQELFKACPFIDEVIPLPGASTTKSPLLELVKRVRAEKFDLILDWHANLRSRLLCLSSIPTIIIRYPKGSLHRRLLIWTRQRVGQQLTTTERYLKTLEKFRFTGNIEPPELHLIPEEQKWAEHKLTQLLPQKEGLIISIGPGARHATKRWPSSRYKELTHKLLESKLPVRGIVLLGDKNDYDLSRDIFHNLQPRFINLAGSLTIRETASIINQSKLMITNDTGLMHLATAVQTPVVALFGPTSRELGFSPLGEQTKVVETPLSCRPCSLHGSKKCPIGTFECMESISVALVYQAACSMLRDRVKDNG